MGVTVGRGAPDRAVKVVTVALLLVACAASHIPAQLRGYDIVVEPTDEQSRALAGAMRDYGFHVRERVRGGSRPTAVLIHFLYSEPGTGQPVSLHLRLADTRSGAIVAAAAVPLDSVGSSARARAEAAVRALAPAP